MSIHRFKQKKENQEKITIITAYDCPSARLAEASGVDAILVGDTVAMVVHGYDQTVHATIEMMCLHTAAVARGVSNCFVIGDMPFMSYRTSDRDALIAAGQLIQAGAHAVKCEGAAGNLNWIEHAVQSGIPVMGHVGLTPQHIHSLGGFKVQGKSQDARAQLLDDAKALEKAGCFAIVLECVPRGLAKEVSESLSIPTIGIGAGPDTDGQVLVWHDMLGYKTGISPRFLRKFGDIDSHVTQALSQYVQSVNEGDYPAAEHCYRDPA